MGRPKEERDCKVSVELTFQKFVGVYKKVISHRGINGIYSVTLDLDKNVSLKIINIPKE